MYLDAWQFFGLIIAFSLLAATLGVAMMRVLYQERLNREHEALLDQTAQLNELKEQVPFL